MSFTFSKEERLCSRKLMDRLYAEGHRLKAFPYSVQWLAVEAGELPEGVPCQVMVVAPKRRFRHAVDRNRVKRLTRECYRLRKPLFYDFLRREGVCLVVAMVYVHNEIMSYEQLGHKMDKLLAALERTATMGDES